jgi:uncharacterized protein (DUF1501 family)
MLSRRKFLGIAGGVAAGGAAAAGARWAGLLEDHASDRDADAAAELPGAATGLAGASTAGRVLVVVQLGGGNDGLNTLVPSAGRYRDARPTLAVPEAKLVAIHAEGYSLHPALASLAARWDAGQIAAVQGLGLSTQSRSHFKAMDTWWAGTDKGASTTGWLGRWLDATEGATPNPLRAVSLGTGAPALVGTRSLPTVVLSPRDFTVRTPRGTDAKAITQAFLATAQPLSPGLYLPAAQQAVPDALDAVDAFARLRPASAAEGATTAYAPETVTSLLESAAGLIDLDIGTQVVLVGVNGFDTHADQLDRHDELWRDVAGGIDAFLTRVQTDGNADRVLVVTTSEFGRRVAENASGGTDHGLASVQFVAGAKVRGGRVVGDLGIDRLVDGDLPITVDTRSLYAIALSWLGGPVDPVLGGRFDTFDLV